MRAVTPFLISSPAMPDRRCSPARPGNSPRMHHTESWNVPPLLFSAHLCDSEVMNCSYFNNTISTFYLYPKSCPFLDKQKTTLKEDNIVAQNKYG